MCMHRTAVCFFYAIGFHCDIFRKLKARRRQHRQAPPTTACDTCDTTCPHALPRVRHRVCRRPGQPARRRSAVCHARRAGLVRHGALHAGRGHHGCSQGRVVAVVVRHHNRYCSGVGGLVSVPAHAAFTLRVCVYARIRLLIYLDAEPPLPARSSCCVGRVSHAAIDS